MGIRPQVRGFSNMAMVPKGDSESVSLQMLGITGIFVDSAYWRGFLLGKTFSIVLIILYILSRALS